MTSLFFYENVKNVKPNLTSDHDIIYKMAKTSILHFFQIEGIPGLLEPNDEIFNINRVLKFRECLKFVEWEMIRIAKISM